jgi:hypothetical protein
MARSSLLAILLLAGGCGGPDDEVEPRANSVEELTNRLDKLADRTSEDIEPPDRLAFLQKVDVEPRQNANPACRLHSDGRLYLVVNATGAVARVDGRRVPLAVSGPVGPTGGFFSAPGVTLSVGRLEPTVGAAGEYGSGWPARVTVGGDKERPIEKHEATWICVR